MSLYLDASCLLKTLFPEAETARVLQLVAADDHVVVSTLARLETSVQIHARRAGGLLGDAAARALSARLDAMLALTPYEVVRTPAEVVDVAERQLRALARGGHCPTLDRLHLAVMESLGLRRLLTNDQAQARAARARGLTVILPR